MPTTWSPDCRPPLELAFVSILLSAVIGIPLGVLAAVDRNSWLDHVLRIFTVSGLAIAAFWLAILFQFLFAMELGVTPLQGRIDGWGPDPVTGFFLIDSAWTGDWEAFRSAAHHMVLPAVTLSFPAMATVMRFTRAGVLDAINSNYVDYQNAMGVPRRVVVWRYVLRNTKVRDAGLMLGALRRAPLPLGGRGWGRASRRDGRPCRASPAAPAGAEAAPHPASPASGRGVCRRQSA